MTEHNRQFEGPRWGQGDDVRAGSRGYGEGERQWGGGSDYSQNQYSQGQHGYGQHGYGPGGTRRIIEATAVVQVGRARLISWREIR